MKKISLLLVLLISVLGLSAQRFPAEGIGYQAMLSKPERVTYGAKLKNIPISNTDIKVRFELLQSGAIVLTDAHNLSTNVNGIFSCIIGTGTTIPAGFRMSQVMWGRDSVTVKVYVNPGDGEFLFSEQKMWSTAYAMHAATSDIALLDNDTSATNELQYISLTGDSVTLTMVAGGISLKPWSDGIAKNAADLIAEKNRAESAEALLKQNIEAVDVKNVLNINELKDSIGIIRGEINVNRSDINKNAKAIVSINAENIKQDDGILGLRSSVDIIDSDIDNLRQDSKRQNDSLVALRNNINANSGDIVNIKAINKRQDDSLVLLRNNINANSMDIVNIKAINKRQDDSLVVLRKNINTNSGDIANIKAINKRQDDSIVVLRKNINTNSGDIANIKAVNKRQDDSLVVLRKNINTNSGDIANIKAVNKRQDDSLIAHRTDINKNTADIAKHLAADKDTSRTNELTDLSFDKTNRVLKLSNPKSTMNEVDLGVLQDNMGDHWAKENIKLNGNFLSNDGGNEGIYVDESGRVALNNRSNDTSLSLDLTKAGRPSSFPVLTTIQRNKIINVAEGAVIFNSTSKKVESYVKGGIERLGPNTFSTAGFYEAVHAQTFKSAKGGILDRLRVFGMNPRSVTPLAVVCKLYEGTPGSSATYICDADTTVTSSNSPSGTMAIYVFSKTKPVLTMGKTYYLEFSNATSSDFSVSVSGFNCSTDAFTSGEYFTGSSSSNLAAKSSGCNIRDIGLQILIQEPGVWETLNEGFNVNEVDNSVTNELQDLVYNSTTKKLTLSPATASGKEIDLSAIGGADNMGDHKATQNVNLNGQYLSGDGDAEGIFIDKSGRVSLNTQNIDTSLSLDLSKAGRPMSFPVLTTSQRDKIANATLGSVIYNSTKESAEIFAPTSEVLRVNSGSAAFFDAIQGQTFQYAEGGILNKIDVQSIYPKSSTPLAVVCKLYEGTPGSSAKYICDADSAITCQPLTNGRGTYASYTFNTAKPQLTSGKTYYFEFSNASSSEFMVIISNAANCGVPDNLTSGEYYSGSSMATVAARSSGCLYRDIMCSITIKKFKGVWKTLYSF
jgi:hypothetical protein